MLKFPPIKPKPFPDCLIYKTERKYNALEKHEVARIISLKDGKLKGEAEFYPALNSEKIPSVFVARLIAFERKKGYGTKLLNYIKRYSQNIGFNGNFFLEANSCFLPLESPHTFYRK